MTDRHRQQWEALGRLDPYWAVITESDKKGGGWDPAEFFASGAREVAGLMDQVSRLGIAPARDVALDYGCGVGRLSRALAERFGEVLAVDHSESMLAEARRANAGFANIRFMRNDGRTLSDVGSESVDFIYSTIALQHAPPDVQRAVIREFARVVRRGGAVVFQTPSSHNLRTAAGLVQYLVSNRVLNAARRLRHGKGRVMEVHALPKAEVLELLLASGLTVVEVERYDVAGDAFVSYRYFATRP